MSNPRTIEELRRIQQSHGGYLRPRDVVDAARPVESPLHHHFTWNDDEAAERWRLEQARQLIRVVVEYFPMVAKYQRVFVSLTTDRKAGNGYRSTVAVLEQPDQRAQMLADALNELRQFQAKYAMLSELTNVFAAIQDLDAA